MRELRDLQPEDTVVRATGKVAICILLGLFTVFGAQAEELNWARNLGGTDADFGHDVAVDTSGNVYTVGSFTGTADFDPGTGTHELPSAGMYDVFISKLDSAGDFVWAKSLGGAEVDHAFRVAVDVNGNVYTVGWFGGTADFDPGPGTYDLVSEGESDVFISKLDSAGNFAWAKRLGGVDFDYSAGVALDTSSNVYTASSFYAAPFDFAFISKFDSAGNPVWARTLGGPGNAYAEDLAVDASGGVYTVGGYYSLADFDPGPGTYNLEGHGPYISKLDSAGNFVWAKRLGGSDVYTKIVALDTSGNIHTAGTFWATVDFDPGPGIHNLIPAGAPPRCQDSCRLRLSGSQQQ